MPTVEDYSDNLLTNPSAETGDITGWNPANADVVAGGTSGDYCFRLDASASLLQSYNPVGTKLDFKLSFDFLPEYPPADDKTEIEAKTELKYNYDDSTFDKFIVICKGVD